MVKKTEFISENIEEYLASIVTNSNDAIIGKTLEGIVTSWNPAAEKLYGYSSAEIVGKSINLIYPVERKSELKKILKQIRIGEKIESFETVRVRKDGSYIDVAITVSPIKGKDNKVIGISDTTRDITEKKRAELHQKFLIEVGNLLSTSLDYSTTLQSVANLAIQGLADWCAIDLYDGNSVELVAVAHKNPKKVAWAKKLREEMPPDMNDIRGLPKVLKTAEAEIYPYLSDEVLENMVVDSKQLKLVKEIGIRSIMIVPLRIRKLAIGAMTFVSSSNSNLYDEYTLSLAQDLADKAAFAVENAKLFKAAQEELEERKRVERALRSSEKKFQKLMDADILGVLVAKFDGSIIEANDSFLKMLGFSNQELKDGLLKWNELTPSEWLSEDAKAIEELKHFGSANPWEKEYFRKDGSRIPVLIGCTMLDEKEETVLTLVLDITERKKLEMRKDDFISIASHELKTPVTSIKVFTQILEKRFQKNSEDKQTLELIRKMDTQLNKLIVLISDLLDVTRIQSGKLAMRPEKFSLDELVEEHIEALEDTTPQKFVYKNGIKVLVEADKERIGQVVTNFLTNAVKYSPPNKEIIVSLEKSGNDALVSVKDFGIGIAKSEQKRIFERFYQSSSNSVSNTFPGLGMGLYISSEIIRRHGGKIGVESIKGRGSNFFFTIPLQNSFTIPE